MAEKVIIGYRHRAVIIGSSTLVTSAIVGHGGSVVSALDPQAKGGVHIPVVTKFFYHKYFSVFPFQPLSTTRTR